MTAHAPALSACARIRSSGKAVKKMNGTRYPWVSKWACKSTPLMPGIWTSAITHESSSRAVRLQELFGGCECMYDVAERPQKAVGRCAHRCIIVNDGD